VEPDDDMTARSRVGRPPKRESDREPTPTDSLQTVSGTSGSMLNSIISAAC
jgi:hypothetical protein